MQHNFRFTNAGRVVLNAAPARVLSEDLERLVDVLVVNAIEAEQLAKVPVVDTLVGALHAAKELTDRFPVVVVTAGGEGVACATRAGDEFAINAIKVELVSTHGAGDEFTGVLAADLARGKEIRAALESANQAAAVLVSTPNSNGRRLPASNRRLRERHMLKGIDPINPC